MLTRHALFVLFTIKIRMRLHMCEKFCIFAPDLECIEIYIQL